MQRDTGIIKVVQMEVEGIRTARIDCPSKLIPSPGKYTLAYNPGEPDSVLGWPLFLMGFATSLEATGDPPLLGPIPTSWNPGNSLNLRGPIGLGFKLPSTVRRVALAAFGDTPSRLLPLISPALESGADVAIFSPVIPPTLPPAVEIHPLSALPNALSWADFLAIDLPVEELPKLSTYLGWDSFSRLPCLAQALIWTPMPCGAMAGCGACAVPAHRGYKLACKDGPVFDLNELMSISYQL